jgi:RHH-type proline utilization regulon transcriptional repressor/proline dehydrogenase/delta 1-pyrroline-5-carboxylate dehydrogenase
VVGQAETFGTDVPPLIDRTARDRVQSYVEIAAKEGELVTPGPDAPDDGWFVSPALVTGLPDDSAVLRDEIFGPVLAVSTVTGVGEACDELERSPFALTAGLFSRDPEAVREVTRRAPAGNLYVNRAITGAVVGRQPFGGNRRSGVGSKAGGPDYLLQFVEPRVVSENTMRHGLRTG